VSRDVTAVFPIVPSGIRARFQTTVGQDVWLGTNHGTYRVRPNDDKAQGPFPGSEADITLIDTVGQDAWLATDHGAYRVRPNDDKAQGPFPGSEAYITRLDAVGQDAWMAPYRHGAYRVRPNDDKAQGPFPDGNTDITGIDAVGQDAWLETVHGAYRVRPNDDKAQGPFPDGKTHITRIDAVGQDAWMAPYRHGAYRVHPNDDKAQGPFPDGNTDITGIVAIGQEALLLTFDGGKASCAYLSVAHVRLNVRLVADDWLSAIWRRLGFWVSGRSHLEASYSSIGGKSLPASLQHAAFYAIWADTEKDYASALKEGRYDLLGSESALRDVSVGRHEFRIAVKNGWGNLNHDIKLEGFALPSAAVLPTTIILLGICFLVVALVLAPWVGWCHNLIMDPYIRRIGSFGLVPLLLTAVPGLRRYILRRYRIGLIKNREWKNERDAYVVLAPQWTDEAFLGKLLEMELLLVLGPSGIGKTAFLRYLVWQSLANQQAQCFTPIYLQARRFEKTSGSALVLAELARYGDFTDEELARAFLKQGGFLVCIDGLNESSDSTRGIIDAFINDNRRSNWFALTSQVAYEEVPVPRDHRIEIAPLTPEKVREYLNTKLGNLEAKRVLANTDEAHLTGYTVPQDLELAIELVRDKTITALPGSPNDLYRLALAPISSKWEREEHRGYTALLFERAYDMLTTGDQDFRNATPALPAAIISELLDRRFLFDHNPGVIFRKERIMAYLAARHFAPRWRTCLEVPSVTPDINWETMLQFTIVEFRTLSTDEAAAKTHGLLTRLVDMKCLDLTAELFKWVDSTYPDLTRKWKDEFERHYGRAQLRKS
jgi:hypothetical protein